MPSKKPTKKGTKRKPGTVRDGATIVQIFNSGLEVWLYDEQNLAALRKSRAIAALHADDPAKLASHFRTGALVAYSLYQDDGLHIGVAVGPPLTDEELSGARWLKPQTAFLRLPSGKLCLDSNDTLRFGEEEVGDEGATVLVPPGDYRLTLYRIDYEALEREERKWKGPQEFIVLTPGSSAAEAADDFLPFEPLRDTSWAGAYRVEGSCCEGLIWFADYWETFVLNLDRAAVEKLGLVPGKYFRVTAPDTGLSILAVFSPTWAEARKLAPLASKPAEYAFGAIAPMADWNGAELLCCRRDSAKTAIKPAQRAIWISATVEVLDLPLAQPPARLRGPLIYDAGKRVFFGGTLAERSYFDKDLQFLTAQLMSRVADVPWGEAMPVSVAVGKVDAALAELGLQALGDFSFDCRTPRGTQEYTNRLYGGLPDTFAAIWGSVATFVMVFFSRLADGRWVLTATIPPHVGDAITRQGRPLSARGVAGRLDKVLEAHREHLTSLGSPAEAIPTSFPALVELYEDYLVKALD